MTGAPTAKTCAACGEPLSDRAAFCPICGTPTSLTRPPSPPGVAGDAPVGADRRHVLQSAVGDSCEVRELIGRGGFAEVYAGWDVRLKREVAIKTIRADIASPSVLERFQHEAEAVAKLRHPHIIPIYGVGETNGIAFFTMPRISGESLGAAIEREKRLPVAEACRILVEAAGALDEAHRAGVVHRDIKPENIMLEGRDRRALVMDFGISKSAGGGERGLTGTGMVMGTPQYMSPEQAAGDRALDHRSDQYSLAMIGYRMLTGKLPFEADSMQTMLMKQVTEQPEPLRSVAPEVPERVAAAIERALAKRPEDRFASMADFAAALSAAREQTGGTRLRRRAVSLPDRIARMRRLVPGWKHPLTIAAVAAAVVFVALGGRNRPDVAMDVAGQREEALFAARSHLVSRGVTGPIRIRATPETRTATYDFLRETVGGDSAAALGRHAIPIWLWHMQVKGDTGALRHVDVAPGSRIVRDEVDLPDSATVATVSVQRAESLAVAGLRERGVDATRLTRRPDSTVTQRNRTDHYFRWRDPAAAIAFQDDTGFRLLSVRVSGDQVTDFSDSFVPPRAWNRRQGSRVLDFIGAAVWLIVGALAVYGLILAIARQRDDAIQWRTGLMLAAFVLVLLAFGALPGTVQNLRFVESPFAQAMALVGLAVFTALGVLVVVVFGYATGESLAAEQDLPATDGVSDLARGQLMVPELATAAVGGLALGSLVLGLGTLNQLIWGRVQGASIVPEIPESLTWSVPLPAVFLGLASGVGLAIAILYAHVLAVRWTGKGWVAVLAPALLMTGLLIGFDDTEMPARIMLFVGTLAVSYAVWRYGLLAGALAIFLWDTADTLSLHIQALGPSTGALVAVLALAAPFLLGARSWRRFRA